MQYVFQMQNAGILLSTTCLQTYGWRCIMAPYAAQFISTPWFMFQSRYDQWQLSKELFMPCIVSQPFSPPYNKSTCNDTDVANIQSYGVDFLAQFGKVMNMQGTKNGAFLDACIIHGTTDSQIDGMINQDAFDYWLKTQGGDKRIWVMKCNGSETEGPCDPSSICAPF